MLETSKFPREEKAEVIGRCPHCKKARWSDVTTTTFNEDGSVKSIQHERAAGDCQCH